MEVTSGATWENPNGKWSQKYDITLNDDDGELVFGHEWEDLTLSGRIKWLSAHADEQVVRRMVESKAISVEYAKERLMELKAAKDKAVGK